MRAREFTIKEDDLDQFLQTKGLAPKSSKPTSDAQQFADAMEAEDDITKLALGKIDAKTLHRQDRPGVDTRNTGPTATVSAMSTAVPTQTISPSALPPIATKTLPPVKTAPVKLPVAATKPKVEINQVAGSVPWRDIARHCKQKWNMSISQIAGMMANIAHESSFRSDVETIDSNGLPSGGLFQHNGPRFAQLKQKLGKNWKNNWQGQIDFALTEPDGANYIAKKYPNADAASRAWTMNFERPAKARVQAAKRAPTATKYASNL